MATSKNSAEMSDNTNKSSLSPDQASYPSYFKSQRDQELIRHALQKSPFFAGLDDEQIERFVSVAELKTYSPGAVVILEGCVDDADSPPPLEEEEDGRRYENDAPFTVDPMMDRRRQSEKGGMTPSSQSPLSSDLNALDRVVVEQNDSIQGETKEMIEHDSKQGLESSQQQTAGDEQDESTLISHDAKYPAEALVPEIAESNTCAITKSPDSKTLNPSEASDCPQDGTQETEIRQTHQSPEVNQAHSPIQWPPQFSSAFPPPARSGVTRSIYIVRKGQANVWYQPHFRPGSINSGSTFGEGGFIFGRQHSASVLASQDEPLECWTVDFNTFRSYVLTSSSKTELFSLYARQEDETGKPFMSVEEFTAAFQKSDDDAFQSGQDPQIALKIAHTYNFFQDKAGPNRQPRIYLPDFCFLQLLTAKPDPEIDIAFLLMDRQQKGQVCLDDVAIFSESIFPDINLQSQFFQRYFGKDGSRSIRHGHFSQFLVDLEREMGKQAFLRAVDQRGTPEGYLSQQDFISVLKVSSGWRLPERVLSRLEQLYDQGTPCSKNHHEEDAQPHHAPSVDQYFAYGDFLAFQEVLGNLSGICSLVDYAQEIKKGPLSSDDFKLTNKVMGIGGRLSRRQIELIYTLFDLDEDGFISYEDTVQVCGTDFARRLTVDETHVMGGRLIVSPAMDDRHHPVAETGSNGDTSIALDLHGFASYYGVVTLASALGSIALYPIDLIKTRLMSQRILQNEGGKRLYSGALDCFGQAWRTEGLIGLYRGLLPQLIGVAPEKAIKLQVNDLMRVAFSQLDEESGERRINLPLEALAGACAGACQILVTNPMEITKIRLQLQDETGRILRERGWAPSFIPPQQSLRDVIRDLGFPGIYRGASACLLREIPFNAIFFPSYAAIKRFIVQERQGPDGNGVARSLDLLTAGSLASIPAAILTTPADIIKTRIQAIPRPGEEQYSGIRDCAKSIYTKEGGALAFFRGASARTLRIAPQFGISLLAYEQFTGWLGLESINQHRPAPTDAYIDPSEYRSAFGRGSA